MYSRSVGPDLCPAIRRTLGGAERRQVAFWMLQLLNPPYRTPPDATGLNDQLEQRRSSQSNARRLACRSRTQKPPVFASHSHVQRALASSFGLVVNDRCRTRRRSGSFDKLCETCDPERAGKLAALRSSHSVGTHSCDLHVRAFAALAGSRPGRILAGGPKRLEDDSLASHHGGSPREFGSAEALRRAPR